MCYYMSITKVSVEVTIIVTAIQCELQLTINVKYKIKLDVVIGITVDGMTKAVFIHEICFIHLTILSFLLILVL